MTQKKGLRTKHLSLLFTLVVLGYVIVVNYISTKVFTRIDITQSNQYTLSKITKEKLNALQDDMTIDLFFSSNLPPRLKKMQSRVEDVVKEFQRHSRGRIKIEWHDPTLSSEAYTLALSRKVKKDTLELPGIDHSKLEPILMYRGLSVTYRGKSASIPRILSDRLLEKELVQSMVNVAREKQPTLGILKTDTVTPIPQEVVEKYGFQQSPFLTSKRYLPLFEALGKNYIIRYFDLSKGAGIPADLNTLFIPGGGDDYWNNELYLRELDKFLASGGNVVLLAPRVDINLEAKAEVAIRNSKLFEMLAHYGITTEVGLILDKECGFMGNNTGTQRLRYPYFVKVTGEGINKEHEVTKNLIGLEMQWSSPIITREDTTNDLTFDTLLMTSPESFMKEPPLMLAPNQKWDRIFARAKRTKQTIKSFPIVVTATGTFKPFYNDEKDTTKVDTVKTEDTPQGRLVLIGSDNCVSPNGATISNLIFMQNLADWLTQADNLISIRTKNIVDRSLPKWKKEEANKIIRKVRIYNIFLAPILMLLVGLIVLLLRRRIQKKFEEAGTHGDR